MAESVKVIHEDCEANLAKDKSLPNNSCLVIYIDNNKRKYDIVMSQKMVAIFDTYYEIFIIKTLSKRSYDCSCFLLFPFKGRRVTKNKMTRI